MRLVIFRSLFVLTLGAGVLVGVLYIASTVDARSPEVVGFALTQPIPDDPDTALITTSIEVVFNEPVQVDAGTEPLTLTPEVEGGVSWSGSTMIFTPRDPLELETQYVALVGSGIRDYAGNLIGAVPPTFAFRTAGRPAVIETTPDDAATGIALDEPIRITFSTLMDTGAVERSLRLDPAFAHELRWSGEVLQIAPLRPLEPDTEYAVRIEGTAADVAGVALGEPLALSFRTVASGLRPLAFLPTDGVDGVAPAGSIAVIFDRAIDRGSVTGDLFAIQPDVAGALEVVTTAGGPVTDEEPDAGRVLRFTPSGPLPLNTTFEVSIAPGLRAIDGGLLAERLAWSFTTGAPAATLSNQITFISVRAGVANVWAMNPDGSGQHQVSTELSPILDYAVAPDGSRVVVADGRRLISLRADGSARTVLTDDGLLEFDPAFSPNGQRLAFGRADGETGEGLGLWLRNIEGGAPMELGLSSADGSATPEPSDGDEGPGWLRTPRFSPDGEALAFVYPDGDLGIVELPAARLSRVDATAVAAPAWFHDSSGVLITHHIDGIAPPLTDDGLVQPLVGPPSDAALLIGRAFRAGGQLRETALPPGATLAGVDRDGRLAYLDGAGRLRLSEGPNDRGRLAPGAGDAIVIAGAFAPGEDAIAIVIGPGGAGESGRVELLDLESGERTVLAPEGAQPTWLP